SDQRERPIEKTPAAGPGAGPEVVGVVDLVQYQTGTVVSRTLVKKPTGTVTVFAFDVHEGLSEHTAPFDALVFVVDGEAEISIAGTPYRVRAGEMLRLPAGRPHALRAVQRFKMVLVMIRE
ncbi:MAG: cupin domain-containing protein, partial [Candidatus Sulfotelmatobacter sp.]